MTSRAPRRSMRSPCGSANFYGVDSRNVTPLRPDGRRQSSIHKIVERAGHDARYHERRQQIATWNAASRDHQARLRADAGQVRDLLHRDHVQSGGRAGARLHRRHRAAQSRRHGDGPGAVHQGRAGRRDRVRAAAVGDSGVGDRHLQGTQHLGDRRLLELGSERQGGAGGRADDSAAAGSVCLRHLRRRAAAGALSATGRCSSASAAIAFRASWYSRPTGRAFRCLPPATTARRKSSGTRRHARTALLLFRLWRGGQRSGRGYPDAARRSCCAWTSCTMSAHH